MTKPPVLTKQDFVRRYARGEFGNASPTWNTLADWLRGDGDRRDGLFHVRNRMKGGVTWYNLNALELVLRWKVLEDPRGFYISAMAPTEKTLFQGEVMRGDRWGLELTYSTVVGTMREALMAETKRANGVTAMLLLQQYLCDNSLTWLTTLLDEYPDHVVEFSTYSVEWGTLPGFNTVFWEVRRY